MGYEKTGIKSEISNEKAIAVNFLKLSVFAALAIFGTLMTILLVAQMVSAASCDCDSYNCDTCDYDSCDCNVCDSDVCDCDVCNCDCCLTCQDEAFEVVPSRPSTKFERETIYTTIKIRNSGEKAHWFEVSADLCESDCCTSCDTTGCEVTGCVEMRCDRDRVYVLAGETKYVSCSKFVRNAGYYRIKVEYRVDFGSTRRTVYSDKFRVIGKCCDRYDSCGECDECGICDDLCYDYDDCEQYRCFGDYLQKRYRTGDCEWRWKIVEYCPYGCENDKCVVPTAQNSEQNVQTNTQKLGEPYIFMPLSYEMKKCKLSSFTFSIQNKGKADTFELSVEGPAAGWIDLPPLLQVEEGETKRISAYATVPCEAEAGSHEFTVTAKGKTTDTRTGTINVERPSGLFVLSPATDLLLVVLIIIVFTLAIIYRDRIGFERITRGRKPSYKEPESFKCKEKDLKINNK